jgi:Zn-dependent M28 family amino/carboxypeptidase
VAYLNLDMIGSPNALRLVYDEPDAAEGSDAITDAFAAHFDAAGLPWEPIDLDGDSDHGPFTDAGIPTGGLFSGGIEPVTDAQAGRFGATAGVPADPCSHRPCDTIDNVDPGTLEVMARAAASVLAGLVSDD